MKISSSIVVLALAVFSILPMASAQSPYLGGAGGGIYEPGTFRAVAADVGSNLRWPGSVWVSANYADRGLGYRGSYLTAGLKTRMFEDALDGRWLFEGRAHVSEESGFFTNIGIERVFTVHAAGADVSLGAWFDYDEDTAAFAFADPLESVGVTGKIKTRYWDLIANGYFSVGSSDASLGDPTGGSPFFENSLVLVPGIDSGLEGFDVTVRTRPSSLAFINGTFDFGGYGYNSDLVDFFGGGRARLTVQMLRGMILTGEVNYDERFDVTGLVGVTLLYGANPRGHEYSPLGRDLERTVRNDHIVRYNREVVLAIDPDTGVAYNVLHVDNTAVAGGDGTFERPFNSLASAQAAGATDDIIFVNDGDGTANNYTSIELLEGQQLLGDGVRHAVEIANGGPFGTTFILENDVDGLRPQITGMNNMAAVTLDSRNTVRGFEIDGAAAVGGMSHGIEGEVFDVNRGGVIEDVMIRNAILDGISITNSGGDWTVARNDIQENGRHGISFIGNTDASSIFNFDSNVASNNDAGSGIQVVDYNARALNFTNNTTNSNGLNGLPGSIEGVLVQNFTGNTNIGAAIVFDQHTSQLNTGFGINVTDGAGSLVIMNSEIGTRFDSDFFAPILIGGPLPVEGNTAGGINIENYTTPGVNQIMIVDNEINGNGVGNEAGLNISLDEGISNVFVTGNQIDFNGVGINAFTTTATMNPTTLNLNIVENESVGGLFIDVNLGAFFNLGNTLQGIRVLAEGESSVNMLVEQTSNNNLQIFGNGSSGIDLIADEDSTVVATIRDATISANGGDGVFGQSVENGQLSVLVEDSIVGRDVTSLVVTDGNTNGFNFAFDNNEGGRINTVFVRNVTASDNVFNAFSLTTNAGTLTDVAIVDSVFDNPFLGAAVSDGVFVVDGGNPIGNPDRGFSQGIVINANGDNSMGNPQIDNRTRLFIQDTTVDRFTLEGLQINATGDARVLADLVGNTISTNGFPAGNSGIQFNASGASAITSTLTGNLSTANAGSGFDVNTAGTATVNALFEGNNLAMNGNINDVTGNAAGGAIGLAFSNNAVDMAGFANPTNFILELDGFTNGVTFEMPVTAGVNEVPFGTVVEPAIELEEDAFSDDGFPASPPVFP